MFFKEQLEDQDIRTQSLKTEAQNQPLTDNLMKNILLGILAFVAVFLVSCTNSKAENTQITQKKKKSILVF